MTAAVASAVLVAFATRADLAVANPEQLVTVFEGFRRDVSGLTLGALRLLGTAWQASVWAGGLMAVHDLNRRAAGGVAGLVAVALLVLSL